MCMFFVFIYYTGEQSTGNYVSRGLVSYHLVCVRVYICVSGVCIYVYYITGVVCISFCYRKAAQYILNL